MLRKEGGITEHMGVETRTPEMGGFACEALRILRGRFRLGQGYHGASLCLERFEV